MSVKIERWCDRDKHNLFENFTDFNEWLDSDEGVGLREKNKIDGFLNPSKAFFAGDKEGYDQAFKEYQKERLHYALSENYLCAQFADEHWFQRNIYRFAQLVTCIADKGVVPFIGAGLSVDGGFPSWKDHLRQQGRTAGIPLPHIEELLNEGKYEAVIEEIENSLGRDVFTQEIRDVFSRTGTITDTTLKITELFNNTIITTNYDRLLEQAFDTGKKDAFQIINGLNPFEEVSSDRVTIIKLHGDIQNPARCILSKNQYDAAYGKNQLDMTLKIPRLLEYYFKNSNLLFLGCSLNNDRTIEVFRAVKAKIGDASTPQHFCIEQAPEYEEQIVERNAHLAALGITAIWFEKGSFEYVGSILRQASNEMRYMGLHSENLADPDIIKAVPLNKKDKVTGIGFIKGFLRLVKT